ncbi:MAG: acyl-CoA dehydrogenase family protein [Polymorphobacter sp.]
MSLLYDDGQIAIATETRRIVDARETVATLLALLEQTGAYDQGFWAMCRDQGWTAMTLPEAVGGLDLGLVELGLVAQAAGRATSGAPFLTSCFGAARAIAAYGSTALVARWLPRLSSGDAIGAIAFGEGQSPLPATTTVGFKAGTLHGTKPAVSAGLHADVGIVLANESGVPVLVVAALDTVARTPLASFDNSRCTADLVFADTPAEVIAHGPAALAAAIDILAAQAVVTAHEQMGAAEALMERARDYANTRRAFGQPIGAFQSVKHRIAELYALVELARANAIHAASRDGAADFIKAAAAARLSATEAYDTAARDCVQVHGGIGVTWESGLHLHMRRARTLAIEQGNSFFWEDLLVDELMKDAA